MSYLEDVVGVVASGGHAAPEENLVSVAEYFSNAPALEQKKLKKKISDMGYKRYSITIDDLIPTQEFVDTENFKDVESINKPVKVFIDSDGIKLVDGHHRCASLLAAGVAKVKAYVYS